MNRPSRFILALAACAAALPVATASAQSPLLFSVNATGSVVAKSGATYTITLPGRSNLAWFTDRPARRAGVATVGDLVDGWGVNRFDSDPPNAALVMTRRGVTRQVVVTLTRGERRGRNVVFTARPLPGTAATGRVSTAALRPGRYGRTEVFIDDGTVPPCGYQHSSPVAIDCTLGAGDGYVALTRAGRFANGVSLTATGADATPIAVTFTRSWLAQQAPNDQCPSPCYGQATASDTATTTFTRTFDALAYGSKLERVQVNAPATAGAVVRVQLSPR